MSVIMPTELLLQITTVPDAYLQYCALAHLPYESDVPRGAGRSPGTTRPGCPPACRRGGFICEC